MRVCYTGRQRRTGAGASLTFARHYKLMKQRALNHDWAICLRALSFLDFQELHLFLAVSRGAFNASPSRTFSSRLYYAPLVATACSFASALPHMLTSSL